MVNSARLRGIGVDGVGHVFVVDGANNRVQEFNSNGGYISQFGTKGTGTGQFMFSNNAGIVSDGRGNLWVTDSGNGRIQKWWVH